MDTIWRGLGWQVFRTHGGWHAFLWRGDTLLRDIQAHTRIGLQLQMWWITGTVRRTPSPTRVDWPRR